MFLCSTAWLKLLLIIENADMRKICILCMRYVIVGISIFYTLYIKVFVSSKIPL